MAFEQLNDGVLPIAVSIDQLPVRIRKGELEFRCTFFPLSEGENPRGLLIVVDDVTEQLRQAQDESERSELMALMQELTRDRHGFLSFMEEAGQLIEDSASRALNVASVASLLHTLKGTTAMVGGTMLAALCHRAEEELGEEGLAGAATMLTLLQGRWAAVQEAMVGLLGHRPRNAFQATAPEIEQSTDAIRAGAEGRGRNIRAARGMAALQPVERPLDRLGYSTTQDHPARRSWQGPDRRRDSGGTCASIRFASRAVARAGAPDTQCHRSWHRVAGPARSRRKTREAPCSLIASATDDGRRRRALLDWVQSVAIERKGADLKIKRANSCRRA